MPVVYQDILDELTGLRASLDSAITREGGPTEDDVWRVYSRMERLAAILKLRMGVEGPRVLQEVPRSKTPGEFLSQALDSAGLASEKLSREQLPDALAAIRSSRTSLRAYLAELNRARAREKRRAGLVRRASR